ncbi:response regulator [Thalassoporum mexicanum]|uniref:response regulator n=1 Tax=Thalassoporum mexicanum TaxID=3457544 RepID=UPI0002D74C71|nr:response regulator [Pseudanabaena sp. PCC 7367]
MLQEPKPIPVLQKSNPTPGLQESNPIQMLQKINPIQQLAEISSSHASGRLDVASGLVSWRIYIQDGDLKYVECSVQSLSQLNYHLCRQGWNDAHKALKQMPKSELGADAIATGLYWLLENQHLALDQAAEILKNTTQNSLESYLWLTEGSTSWSEQMELPEWVTAIMGNSMTMDLGDLVKTLQKKIRTWQKSAPAIDSPYVRPYILDYRNISKVVPNGTLSDAALKKLSQVMRGFSIRQLSLLLKQDELHVAQMLSPYIQKRVIYLRNPQQPFDQLPRIPRPMRSNPPKPVKAKHTEVYKIVCIDDSPTILSEIKRFLTDQRFQVTAVNDPIEASSIIFRIKPDLILLDISMPKINGYRLCGLLRSSSMFDNTPIIMVTGNTGFLDKARAKLAGATDYLTKPFTSEGLNAFVYKYLKVT